MVSTDEYLERVRQTVITGDDRALVRAATDALAAGIDALSILNDGLMAGTDVVSQRFETGEYFLPQLMLTGRALRAAMTVLEPSLKDRYASGSDEVGDTGVVVLATVQTDIHDIGKNIVSSMLAGSGFEVCDLGVDVPIKEIITKAQEVNAHIIGCSTLLTTSMPFMRDLIDLLEAMGERDRFKVMVGGAAVTPEFAARISADGTASNAVRAVQLARRLIRERRAAPGGPR
jgi:corrinoid protein of di/trimethylamine methyltransferase